MAETGTIQVLILESEETLPGRRMIPGAGTVAARVMDVPIDAVKQGIQKVTEQISEIVRDLPTDQSSVNLSQISVNLNVSATGSVQWIAGLGAAVGSGIALTFDVAEPDNRQKET